MVRQPAVNRPFEGSIPSAGAPSSARRVPTRTPCWFDSNVAHTPQGRAASQTVKALVSSTSTSQRLLHSDEHLLTLLAPARVSLSASRSGRDARTASTLPAQLDWPSARLVLGRIRFDSGRGLPRPRSSIGRAPALYPGGSGSIPDAGSARTCRRRGAPRRLDPPRPPVGPPLPLAARSRGRRPARALRRLPPPGDADSPREMVVRTRRAGGSPARRARPNEPTPSRGGRLGPTPLRIGANRAAPSSVRPRPEKTTGSSTRTKEHSRSDASRLDAPARRAHRELHAGQAPPDPALPLPPDAPRRSLERVPLTLCADHGATRCSSPARRDPTRKPTLVRIQPGTPSAAQPRLRALRPSARSPSPRAHVPVA